MKNKGISIVCVFVFLSPNVKSFRNVSSVWHFLFFVTHLSPVSKMIILHVLKLHISWYLVYEIFHVFQTSQMKAKFSFSKWICVITLWISRKWNIKIFTTIFLYNFKIFFYFCTHCFWLFILLCIQYNSTFTITICFFNIAQKHLQKLNSNQKNGYRV